MVLRPMTCDLPSQVKRAYLEKNLKIIELGFLDILLQFFILHSIA